MKFTHLFMLILIINAKAFLFSEDQCQEVYKHLAKGVGIGAIPAILIASGYGALSAIGFTSTGIAGGSIAAATQASVGNVVAGSLFSSLQSAAMVGMSWILTPALVIGGLGASAYVSAYVYDCYSSFKHLSDSDPEFKSRLDKKIKEEEKEKGEKEQKDYTKEQQEPEQEQQVETNPDPVQNQQVNENPNQQQNSNSNNYDPSI